jgi:hypothetical protein
MTRSLSWAAARRVRRLRGEHRADVIRLVRGIENDAERSRRRGESFAEVSWMRGELGIDDELAA